ncbi:GTPase HflX [bacterium]|nr:GTPase HflX [bacterium]
MKRLQPTGALQERLPRASSRTRCGSRYARGIVTKRTAPIDLTPAPERAFLIAVDTGSDVGWPAEDSLQELASLARTAGAEVVGAEWQQRRHPDPDTYIGAGKANELLAAKVETGFTVLIADDELSPTQQRGLEEVLGVKVIDRSRLILDIFALHARTREGRLQVELAQLEYQLPRLTKLWTHLSRTGGGIGTRGPGESQLETDRRLIRDRISVMKARVDQVRRSRETGAKSRTTRGEPTVAIVGYTNAGKSTVDAFRATLEEVSRADLLLEVVDASDHHALEHRATVQAVLEELGASEKPRIIAANKIDAAEMHPREIDPAALGVSAATGLGLGPLRSAIEEALQRQGTPVDLRLPYTAVGEVEAIRARGGIQVAYDEDALHVTGFATAETASELKRLKRNSTAKLL